MRGIEPDYSKWNPQPKKEKIEKKYAGINKISSKALAKKDEKKQLAIELDKAARTWYDSHPTKKCIECGQPILFYTKMNCHHGISKKDADLYNIEIALNPDVMILVCLNDHSKAETNKDFCPKIKAEEDRIKKEFEKYLI